MSRYYDDDDGENFPGQWELYQANLERAFRGKRGRKFLADLREALVALPQQRLIEGALCTVGAEVRAARVSEPWAREDFTSTATAQGEGVCAIGAYLWHRQVKAGVDPEAAFASLPTVYGDQDGGLYETAHLAVKAGVVASVAWDVAYRNDETFATRTPEGRHAAFLAWIGEQLGEQPEPAGSNHA